METAASAIAFVTLTSATVKSCHDLLLAVKDGPEKLNHVNTAICTLVSAFEQIKTESDFKIICSSTSLKTVTENCKADFESFKARLEKVGVLPDERRCGKLWKRLKLAFVEKDLPWTLAVVNGHVDAVTMELNIIQFRSLHRVEEKASCILAQQETYSVRIEEQLTNLDAVRKHASDAAERGAHVRDAIEVLTQKMIAMSSASEEQVITMSEMLQTIQETIMKSKANPTNDSVWSLFNEPLIRPTASDPGRGVSERSTLKQSMGRLSDLVANVECTLGSGDAMEIINDLDTLLRTAAKWNREIESTSYACVARHSKPGLEIHELRGQLLGAKSVQINKALTRTAMPGSSVTRQQYSYAEYKGSDGILRVQHRYRILDRGIPKGANFSDETNIATWMPYEGEGPFSITISHHERVVAGMVSSLPPNLVVSPVLELDHPVFNTVRHGHVDDLRRLLSEKKAWLRARDPYGASLLHYAFGNANILQFLIMNGADVDDLAHAWGAGDYEGYLISPLHLSVCENHDNSACFKQLLAAGADPFLPARDIFDGRDEGAAITDAVTQSDYAYLKAAADEIANTYDAFGIFAAGPELLRDSTRNYRLGNIRILVDQGIDINSENSAGYHCLFTLLARTASKFSLHSADIGAGFQETARFLIESGIDLAPNAAGLTPAQYAYHLALDPRYSSSVGDAWDRALAACGLDVAEFRDGHSRVGRYTYYYTLSSFKKMWDGHENLCPYYEEAIADSAVDASHAVNWSQVCTDEDCPYYDEMREGSEHWDSDESSSSSSEDSSEDGGVTIDSAALDLSEE